MAKHPFSFNDDPRPIVAMDWSVRAIDVTWDGVEVIRVATIVELLPMLDGPHKVVAESSFESWDLERREEFKALLRGDGHELYVFSPRKTARKRRDEGLEKSNTTDACVIHMLAVEGRTHMYRALGPDPEWAALRAELNAEYNLIRRAGAKPELVAAAAAVLGRYRDLDDEAREVLGNGSKYSESLMAAVQFAADHTETREEFERLLGLHGSAYPSLLRSDIMHHSYRHAAKRGVEWPQFRRVVRHTRSRLVAARGD